MEKTEEISFPRMIINIDLAGTNSLIGGLCKELQNNDYLQHIGRLNPTEIVFVIKRVHKELNLYEEVNKVRDVLKIDEKKIIVFMS